MQSDHRYFKLNKLASNRIRRPFPDELRNLPAQVDVPPGHEVVVIVAVRRDNKLRPTLRARGIAVVPNLH